MNAETIFDLMLLSGFIGFLFGAGGVIGIMILSAKSCRDQIDDDYEQPLDHVA